MRLRRRPKAAEPPEPGAEYSLSPTVRQAPAPRTTLAARTIAATATAAAGLAAVSAVVAAAPQSAATATATHLLAATSTGVGSGYWHTSGNQIIDSNGNPVRIAGINWYGFETSDEIAHGLWSQDYHTIINDIKSLGYNTIRIPFSNQMVENPVVPQNLSFSGSTGQSINADLKGQNALQDLQSIVNAAGQAGLKVILDDHRSEAGNSAEQNGLWYTSTYTSANWVNDWTTISKMFAGNPTVIGFDLRNEPHTPAGVAYANGATWGTGDTTTDVRLAYEQAGNAVLAQDPNALVFCEGIGEYPDASASSGYDSTWWGGDLQGVAQYPVTLSSPGHVVYSAHDYGPSLYQQTWFNSSTTPASLDAVWNKYWGYIYTQKIAPLWVGEFGTDNTAADIESSTPGSQGQWFQSLVSYISSNQWMGWTYWALNGEDSFNLLDNGYDPTPVSAEKQSLLDTIEFPLSGGSTGTPSPTPTSPSPTPTSPSPTPTSPSPTPTSPSPTPTTSGSLTCTYSTTNSWSGGFQGQIVIADSGSAVSSWTAKWTFPGSQTLASDWSAVFTQTGASVTASNEPYNGSIAPGSSVTIGFTANGTAPTSLPVTC